MDQATSTRQTVIVVVGAPGTPAYGEQFKEWAGLWQKACDPNQVTFSSIGLDVVGGNESDPNTDRDRLLQVLVEESRESDDPLWLILIGHGTYDGRSAKFNLRGPDVSAKDLADWLEGVNRPLVIINTSASSAPFLKTLSASNRVVITATKSGFEQNATRLGQFLSRTINSPEADLDKDGQTSLLEAFLAASNRVEAFYEGAGRLVTEHALLDDNGDTLGTPAKWFRGIRPTQKAADDAPLDGYRAHQFHLCPSKTETNLTPSQRSKRDILELAIFQLRDNRERYTDDEYFEKLETLLYEIALMYQAVE